MAPKIRNDNETANKRSAVLVGCNYPKTNFRLQGCINDVQQMKEMLVKNFNISTDKIQVLIDVPTGNEKLPTGENIRAALEKMVSEAKEGDVMYFHFSGHGTKFSFMEPGKAYEEHEAIVPCDLNPITEMDLRYYIKKLPENTRFTILSDSCHSGGLIDKEKEQIGPNHERSYIPVQPSNVTYKNRSLPIENVRGCLKSLASILTGLSPYVIPAAEALVPLILNHFNTKDVSVTFLPQNEKNLLNLRSLTEDEGILLSACQANETAADVPAQYGIDDEEPHGAFTAAVLKILEKDKDITYKDLVMKAREHLKKSGYQQHACLYCSDDNADAVFLDFPDESPVIKITTQGDDSKKIRKSKISSATVKENKPAVAANDAIDQNNDADVIGSDEE